ncbi:hypothetical protein QAD02_004253 [Eretmocerus hayati]|uniref:Uncharacterized protein n=1 Tax=Eretmocerus hayati TaxID=131215 RepID=A0ACC2NPG4_9HYME|nr:hypothetical protein QAD02_004253 [Eretmocerus hayati]
MKNKEKPTLSSHIFLISWGFFMHVILLTFKEHTPSYLKSIIQEHGVSGISHTRMPTESRPGNIAIAAGVYEDPSALFKGWKENPVDFDSVFNRSRISWLWGSPDIIPLFTKASYPSNWQDFSNVPEATQRLDQWVFDQYWHWLKDEAPTYKTEDKIIFYFHLLACDTSGHASKPQSKEYEDMMVNVDHNIQQVVEKTEKFFGSNTSAYIFTSDHGMTDWGSHGSGSTDETETPFVAWGAGIAKNNHPHNLEQADITPLISTLAGVPIPVNNEGVLPYYSLDPKYQEYITKAFLANAKQLLKQVKANRELTVGRSLVNMYDKDREFEEKLKRVEKLIKDTEYKIAINELEYLTKLAKHVLSYYRRYQTDRFIMCLMLMWIGWIVYLFVDLSGVSRQSIQFGCYSWNLLANISLVVGIIPLVIEYAVAGCQEWRLFGYGVISVISLWVAFRAVIRKGPTLEINSNKPLVEFSGIVGLMFMMFVGLVYRGVLSISMLLIVGLQKLLFDRNASSLLLATGLALAIFPLLPVVGPQPRLYLVLFAVIASIISIVKKRKIHNYNKIIGIVRLSVTSLLCLNMIDGKSGISWLLLFTSPLDIWMYPKDGSQRIFGVTVALLSPLALLSASYEPIFFLIMAAHLQNWPTYDYTRKSKNAPTIMSLRHFSTAAFLMQYTLLCFFGTGNMASLSSFDPSWTRHFLTVFSPFTMAALILLKTVIPLILVGCLIRSLAPDSSIFSAVLLLGDCLAIPLMYGVTNQGSWLDIGSAISRFVIAIVLPCLLLLVYYLTEPFTSFSLQEFIKRTAVKRQRLKI